MIIPDINILIYAINSDYPKHKQAKAWVEKIMSGDEPVGLPWTVIFGFVRIVTNGKIMKYPIKAQSAVAIVDGWLELPSVRIVEPTERHWKIFKELLNALGTAGNLTSDAHLASLTIEHSACLYSTDNDFGRFQGLRWKNPIVEQIHRSR